MPGNSITYLFDETGTRYGFKLANTAGTNTYWYTFNGQGDVISLVDKTGTVMAKYTYDAWGKLLTVMRTYSQITTWTCPTTGNVGSWNVSIYR